MKNAPVKLAIHISSQAARETLCFFMTLWPAARQKKGGSFSNDDGAGKKNVT